MNYRRYYIPDSTIFIVCVTKDRTPHFRESNNVELLREALRRTNEKYPFEMLAYVFLPDHVHMLMKTIGCNFSQVMQSFKKGFTQQYKGRNHISSSLSCWQSRFWDHVIRNDEDFKRHLNYIHYNPVKHGFVSKPEEWEFSSYLDWVDRGAYEMGWGHKRIHDLETLKFE